MLCWEWSWIPKWFGYSKREISQFLAPDHQGILGIPTDHYMSRSIACHGPSCCIQYITYNKIQRGKWELLILATAGVQNLYGTAKILTELIACGPAATSAERTWNMSSISSCNLQLMNRSFCPGRGGVFLHPTCLCRWRNLLWTKKKKDQLKGEFQPVKNK